MQCNQILSLLASGLEAVVQAHTASALGNRRTYLGLSDLARGLCCPRAVVAGKLATEPSGQPLNKLLTLRRGHWLEHGIEEALAAVGRRFISQLEISVQHQGVPIKAHLDLVLPDEAAQSVTVLELKSVGRLRGQVYGSHEAQLYGQISLLHRLWDQPVFNVTRQFENESPKPASTECRSFPELVRSQLGIELTNDVSSISIQGFVLTVSPNAARAFGPYGPNPDLLRLIMGTGRDIWQSLVAIKTGRATLADIPYQPGFAALCDYCDYNRDCPKFQGTSHPALEPELSSLAELKQRRSSLDDEIKEREGQLKAIAALMGQPGQWISGERHRFKVSSQAGRTTIDPHQLQASLGRLQPADQTQLLEALEAARKPGKAFDRLYLSPINH